MMFGLESWLLFVLLAAACGLTGWGGCHHCHRDERLAREYGMALTEYLEWQRWRVHEWGSRSTVLTALGVTVVFLVAFGGYPNGHREQTVVTVLFLLTALLAGIWGYCRNRASTLEPPARPARARAEGQYSPGSTK